MSKARKQYDTVDWWAVAEDSAPAIFVIILILLVVRKLWKTS